MSLDTRDLDLIVTSIGGTKFSMDNRNYICTPKLTRSSMRRRSRWWWLNVSTRWCGGLAEADVVQGQGHIQYGVEWGGPHPNFFGPIPSKVRGKKLWVTARPSNRHTVAGLPLYTQSIVRWPDGRLVDYIMATATRCQNLSVGIHHLSFLSREETLTKFLLGRWFS